MFCFMVSPLERGCHLHGGAAPVMQFYTNCQMDAFPLIKYVLVENKGKVLFYALLFHVLLEYTQIPIYN